MAWLHVDGLGYSRSSGVDAEGVKVIGQEIVQPITTGVVEAYKHHETERTSRKLGKYAMHTDAARQKAAEAIAQAREARIAQERPLTVGSVAKALMYLGLGYFGYRAISAMWGKYRA